MDSPNSPKSLLTCAAACGVATVILIPVDAWMLRGVIAESHVNDGDPSRDLESGGVGMIFFITAGLTLLFAGIGLACTIQAIRRRSDSSPR